jgi:hypothetical protein
VRLSPNAPLKSNFVISTEEAHRLTVSIAVEKSAVVVAAAFPVVILEADLPFLLPLLLPRPLPLSPPSPLFLLLLFSCHPSSQAEELLLSCLCFCFLPLPLFLSLHLPHSSKSKPLF